jgi:Ca-activated chloride channel family protein
MAEFHFIRPLWLAAILMVIVAIYLLKKYRVSQSGWQQLLPKHLSALLIDDKKTR